LRESLLLIVQVGLVVLCDKSRWYTDIDASTYY
jgi:hypothetical protein